MVSAHDFDLDRADLENVSISVGDKICRFEALIDEKHRMLGIKCMEAVNELARMQLSENYEKSEIRFAGHYFRVAMFTQSRIRTNRDRLHGFVYYCFKDEKRLDLGQF